MGEQDWTTRDEKNFIDGLGTFMTALSTKGRAALLMKYIDALPLRSEWGAMDPDAVRAHAATRLKFLVNQ